MHHKMILGLFIIFLILVAIGGLWFRHFLYGQYIPERGPITYIPSAPIQSEQSILIYGADSSFAPVEDSLSDHPKIYKKFVQILLDYKNKYGSNLEGFVHGGDYLSDYSKDQVKGFIDTTKPVITAGIPFFLVTGNEEGEKGRKNLIDAKVLTRQEPYYTQKFNNFTTVILDTEFALESGSDQYKFLSETLEQAQKSELIIFMHHPFITYGFHDNNIVEFKRKRFVNDISELIKNHKEKIIAVIQSDDHDYQRLNFEGIPVYVSGGLGEGLRATKTGPLTQFATDGIFHYIQILSNKEKVIISGIRFNDEEILGEFDKLEIKL
jgi:hypothetical protein